MIKLAILSPNQNADSSTFISAHKRLPFNVYFYYGGHIPERLEPYGLLQYDNNTKFIEGLNLREATLRSSLKREGINCVMAEFGLTAAESLNTVKSLKLPLVVIFHGFDASVKLILLRYHSRYREVFHYATYVVVVSKKMADDLLRLGCPKEKLVVSYCGANMEFLSIKPQFNKKQFVAVGRFVEKKAPYLTIAAFKRIVAVHPDATLMFIGEGTLLNRCKQLVTDWELQSNVRFTGYLTPQAIKVIFSESLAFVQHSVTAENGDSEGTPVAIMEASAAGLPVISTLHAGIPDIVLDGETGFLVEEFDTIGMSKAMIKVLENPKLAKQLGEAAKSRIEKNFTLSIHLKCLEKLITKACRLPVNPMSVMIPSNENVIRYHISQAISKALVTEQIERESSFAFIFYMQAAFIKTNYPEFVSSKCEIISVIDQLSIILNSKNAEISENIANSVFDENHNILMEILSDVRKHNYRSGELEWLMSWENFCKEYLASEKNFRDTFIDITTLICFHLNIHDFNQVLISSKLILKTLLNLDRHLTVP
jgi:colanic acid/amylovoran biosynthesis glycosyltransferase